MDFELNDDQRMIRDMTRDFARKEIAPYAGELDEKHEFPRRFIPKLAELGLMGMMTPEEYGGTGADVISYLIAMEEIAAACASTAVTMSVNNSLSATPILENGTEEQKKKYLPLLASAEKLGCYCLSEPNAGTDAANQATTFREDGGGFVLNGTKNFITNGAEAGIAIVFATENRELKHKGISAFIVECDRPGFKVGKREKKLGIRASCTNEIVLEDVRVPKENLLGGRGEGFKVAMKTLDGGRLGIAAQALGIGRAAYEAAARYSKQRVAFGKPIASLQAIQFMLADMALKLDASRLLLYRAGQLRQEKRPHTREAAMAKLFASEAANEICTKAIQVHGGYGYCQEYQVERHFRDAKITEIYEGTSEVQRIVIAREELSGF